ncbi:ribose-5-phosphate isomerase [Propionibacterium sp. oral taxon 192]|uniref:ribose-5-phosphate isomerase n=1 Tax=Propionibacterium sp. oral taxon 192 TaxID=671222 RepID=UPI0012ECB47F|nr:ribose-5-phosphate isomerase [Propionibacterium sp. oral taxon 192]
MRVHIGTDHAAFELKEFLSARLREGGYEVVDHGALVVDPEDDYPDFIIPCAQAVAAEEGSLGIVLGGSGNGEQIAANKVPGIRAVLANNVEFALLGRQHNNANVVSLGGRFVEPDAAWEIVRAFLETEYTGEERHARRLAKLQAYEQLRGV